MELLKKIDDRRYMTLEGEIAHDLREQLAKLRQEAIEELALASSEGDDNERETHGS
ncbi:hypothetical protein [Pendulispora albinea]|uniref:Uncharacterized protein n=1 Tax=Pendulispora albinea TaxID=2741071 RepID=A0ABZ2LQF1_9BACT